ncbi:MAG: DUF3604 domain-containing protein [Thermomicrobiales bacterium]
MILPGYQHLHPYVGDLHSHCAVSYGHGSLEDAYHNAQSQLDFASVTVHALWPDMPEDDSRLAAVSDYHRQGFRRAAENWPHYREMTNAVNENGRFVTFQSFEWHSMHSGDHNVYFKGDHGEIFPAPDIESMRARLRLLAAQGLSTFLIPHHIGYTSGYRGIRWQEFTPEFSPVVEMYSMHGCAESDDAPYPYLHTMGPRDGRSTIHHGLRLGHTFGLIGSTDHHSAHPGSYGHGRLGVWARELTRAGIWEAIAARRTYALTGDRIALAFSLNGHPMGSVLPPTDERQIDVSVIGGSVIDYVELLFNNRPLHRWSAHESAAPDPDQPVKVFLELGWGEQRADVDWRVELTVANGTLLTVEPRLRGRDVVAPQAELDDRFVFSSWARPDAHQVELTTRTWQNPTTVTPATQGICLEIQGGSETRLSGRINDQPVALTLADLTEGARAGYLGGFLSPAYRFHRAAAHVEYTREATFRHQPDGPGRDWYALRVRQQNGQWAWSSPIWVEGR